MVTQATSALFAGIPRLVGGGLSNERDLAAACPPEFMKDNPWSRAAMRLYYDAAEAVTLKWKSEDVAEQSRQTQYFGALLDGDLPTREKFAVAGWMLSEMLTEVPA
jgi:hypothetical protein